jgi:hypothetical protein
MTRGDLHSLNHKLSERWLAAEPPCVGFAGWLLDGMDSKPLFVGSKASIN